MNLQQFAFKLATNNNIKPIAGLCPAILSYSGFDQQLLYIFNQSNNVFSVALYKLECTHLYVLAIARLKN